MCDCLAIDLYAGLIVDLFACLICLICMLRCLHLHSLFVHFLSFN